MNSEIRLAFINAGIDVDDCIGRLMNKEEVFLRLMKKFPEDTNFRQLTDAIKSNNVEAAFNAGHALKGVASNLSMFGILEHLVPLVEILRNGSLEGVHEEMQYIEKAYSKIINQIKDID